jgi:uncharacterized protein with PQ loop repeat
MSYQDVSAALALTASIAIILGLYAQAVKIWRTKSARDFTAMIVIAILVNECAWLNYGYSIQKWPIILVSILDLPAAIAITIGYYRYRYGATKERAGER